MENSKKDLITEILIVGMGNPLMSDDGLGIYAVQELRQREWPAEIAIMDIGTSALHYLEEISHCRCLLAVDAVKGGGKPGTVYRFQTENIPQTSHVWRQAHGFSLLDAVELARYLTGFPVQVVVYGVEPLTLSLGDRLSLPVKKALPKVVKELAKEVARILK